jgi:hypothetical protein
MTNEEIALRCLELSVKISLELEENRGDSKKLAEYFESWIHAANSRVFSEAMSEDKARIYQNADKLAQRMGARFVPHVEEKE